ncbi:MAG: carbonate dehydratase [Candidatus Kaelpia imicola]|nr:carbonate dehydratase [Candidatus Kaelpia imicola]
MRNPQGDYPQIDKSAYIDPTAVIIGKVSIGRHLFVGPGAVIRADEPGSSIIIKDNCNIQDRVIIHALENTSVLIEESVSLTHGCIIHGPCKISKRCFIGFGSVIFDSELDQDVVIKHLVVVDGVNIPAGRVVENGKVIRSEEDVKRLKYADKEIKDFVTKVVETNLDLTKRYKRLKTEGGVNDY